MTDNKILQAILDKVSSVELGLKSLEKKMNDRFDMVDKRFDKVDKRVDGLGLGIAEIADDAPTNGEFSKLEKRVEKLEKVVLSV